MPSGSRRLAPPGATPRFRVASAVAFGGLAAFWGGMLVAAARYPTPFDWRYMPISNLLAPLHDPAGFLWAVCGMVVGALCWLGWAWDLHGRRMGVAQPLGVWALQLGCLGMAAAAIPPRYLHGLRKGHDTVSVVAFASLCAGVVSLLYPALERLLSEWQRQRTMPARAPTALLASTALLPIALAALAQAAVFFLRPTLPCASRTMLSFAFWEWLTTALVTAYLAAVVLLANAESPASSSDAERLRPPAQRRHGHAAQDRADRQHRERGRPAE